MGKTAFRLNKPGLVILFFIGILITTLSIYGIGANKLTSVIPKIKNVVSPTPTPFPFSEMTIPAMRSRGYDSKLNELSKYSENSSYTSYLTSYGSDGFKINGLLTIPKGNKPTDGYPAVVFVHGYIAPTIYKTTERYGDYVNYLARNGFVVFKIDLRGHGDSEGDASGAYYSADYVVDTLNAYSALQNFDVVNPKTIGLWGHSMSGNVVFRAFTVKPEIPAVVIGEEGRGRERGVLPVQLLPAQYRVENPFPWMSEAIDLSKEKNFFETRVTEYQVGGQLEW